MLEVPKVNDEPQFQKFEAVSDIPVNAKYPAPRILIMQRSPEARFRVRVIGEGGETILAPVFAPFT